MEYASVTQSEFDDIISVFQERGLSPRYSLEDAKGGGIEYHIYSHIDEVEDILWAVQVVDGREPELSSGIAVDTVIERLEATLTMV